MTEKENTIKHQKKKKNKQLTLVDFRKAQSTYTHT